MLDLSHDSKPTFRTRNVRESHFQNLHRCRLLDLETTETELRPIGLWYGFRWSLSSLKSFLELDTLNLSLAKGLVDDDLREFLHPSSGASLATTIPSQLLTFTRESPRTLPRCPLHAHLRMFCPMGLWRSFRWSPPSLRSFLQLDTLNLSLLTVRMVEDDSREFLYPLQRLTKLRLANLDDALTGAVLRGFSSGTLIPSAASIAFPRGNSIEELVSLLEERLMASRVTGSGISPFTFVSCCCTSPTDPAVVLRLEVLKAAGIQVEFRD
ncbi:hypothetical protein BD779DRAFT_1802589 [Infundibulicybe gibba]|nr:hypothetical protein BD779DRAFT_1802589 [Infundibulicybe gibba]